MATLGAVTTTSLYNPKAWAAAQKRQHCLQDSAGTPTDGETALKKIRSNPIRNQKILQHCKNQQRRLPYRPATSHLQQPTGQGQASYTYNTDTISSVAPAQCRKPPHQDSAPPALR